MLIKLSAEVLAACGAKTADEFPGKLVELLNRNTQAVATVETLSATVESLETSNTSLTSKLTEAENKIKALETGANGMTEARIKQIATEAGTTAGSKTAQEAVGAIGAGAIPAGAAPAGANTDPQKAINALIEAGKYGEAYDADKNIRAEFTSKSHYCAWMRNRRVVRITERT
jgi:TolA-binding protein